MLFSMTGYGKFNANLKASLLEIEIKGINSSKGFDLNLKLPSFYKEKENDLRTLISGNILRGKIDFYININPINSHENKLFSINKNIVSKYISELKEINSDLKEKDYLKIAIKMPDSIEKKTEEPKDIDKNEWKIIEDSILKAIEDFNTSRKNEGNKLKNDIENNIYSIKNYCQKIIHFENERIEKIKENILMKINSLNIDIDKNRFEQEIIYYLEKIDINEEKIRLSSHLDYFINELNDTENKLKGKKLSFISQEIGREINTLGNKCNHIEIQKIVVNMKDELEKIKEQLLNIL